MCTILSRSLLKTLCETENALLSLSEHYIDDYVTASNMCLTIHDILTKIALTKLVDYVLGGDKDGLEHSLCAKLVSNMSIEGYIGSRELTDICDKLNDALKTLPHNYMYNLTQIQNYINDIWTELSHRYIMVRGNADKVVQELNNFIKRQLNLSKGA